MEHPYELILNASLTNFKDIIVAGEKIHLSLLVMACHTVMFAKLIMYVYESCQDCTIFVKTL